MILLPSDGIRVGKFWQSPAFAERLARHYCKQILVSHNFEGFPHSTRGSATAARIGKRCFLFCSGHQISGIEPENLGFMVPHENKLAIPTQLLAYKSEGTPGEDDFFDIRAFEYKMENYEGLDLASHFFEIREDEIWPQGVPRAYWAIGYPYARQEYDPHRFGAFQLCVNGRYAGASSSPHLHRLKIDVEEDFKPDGMSGGPVYYLGGSHGKDFLGLAGMTVRGGGNMLYFIASDVMCDLVTRTPVITE